MEAQKEFREWKPEEYVDRPVTPAEVLPEDDLSQCFTPQSDELRIHDERSGTIAGGNPGADGTGTSNEEAVAGTEAQGFDPHISVGRQKHHQPLPEPVEGPPPEGSTVKEAMAHKLRTAAGRACYAKRKHIVEPVFGQMKHVRGFRQFLLRGLAKVRGEWNLLCLTHNLLKIWRHQCALT
jgi:hypothetical protein